MSVEPIAPAAAPTPSPEEIQNQIKQAQVAQIKSKILEAVTKHYRAFIDAIRHYPCHQIQGQYAIKAFDEGRMWLQEAILNSDLKLEDVKAPSNAPEAPSSDPVDNGQQAG